MEKRVFLAILLSFVVLAVYQAIFPPVQPVPPIGEAVPAPVEPSGPLAADAPAGEMATPAPAALVADSSARDIVVETDAVRAVFTTAGAALKSWQL